MYKYVYYIYIQAYILYNFTSSWYTVALSIMKFNFYICWYYICNGVKRHVSSVRVEGII